MYEKDDRIITDRDVYSVRYDRQASPSLPFPNTSLPLPAPLACISSTHSPRRFVLCVFRPLRSFALAVRFASSCSRERETEMEGGREGEGDERNGEERGGKTSHLRSFFSRSHLFLSLSLSLRSFLTRRIAGTRFAIRLASRRFFFLRLYPVFLPDSLLALFFASLFSSRLVRVRTENSEQRCPLGDISRVLEHIDRRETTRGDAMRSLRKRERENRDECLFFLLPSSFLSAYLFISYPEYIYLSIYLYIGLIYSFRNVRLEKCMYCNNECEKIGRDNCKLFESIERKRKRKVFASRYG